MSESNLQATGFSAPRIGFVGWGPASEAILAHLESGPHRTAEPHRHFQVEEAANNARVEPIGSVEGLFAQTDLIFVEADPQQLAPALPLMRLAISDRHIVVIIGTGWSMEALLHHLHERKLMRCMLRPGAGRNQSLLAIYPSPYFSRAEIDAFRALFANAGMILELDSEAQFEVAQGLAGIAPSAFTTIMEAMADGALMMGLPRQEALKVIASVLAACAQSLLDHPEQPALLRDQALQSAVAATGLMEMESAGIRGLMMRVVQEATRVQRRAVEPLKSTDEG